MKFDARNNPCYYLWRLYHKIPGFGREKRFEMFEIARLTVEGLEKNIVTDEYNPHISYKVVSDGQMSM